MKLTKTDFHEYRACDKAFWLYRHKRDAVVWPEVSAFDKLQASWGYEVERLVVEHVKSFDDAHLFSFQDEFQAFSGLYARADLVRKNDDGSIDLFEVKSSNSVKESNGRDHIVDATFQTIVAEDTGAKVRSVFIVHLNKDYIRQGVIDPARLLVFEDVTARVRKRYREIADAADRALAFLSQDTIDEDGCDCRFKSKPNHCGAFDYFNREIKKPSIYLIPRLRKARAFVEQGITCLLDVPEDALSASQIPILKAAKSGAPVIQKENIQAFIRGLEWPLYFYDYETVASAIPRANGHSPRQQIPVQFSLHRLEEDGTLKHTEYICMRDSDQAALVEHLVENIGPDGHLLAWHKQVEQGCNHTLGKLVPEHVHFLHDMSRRTRDLMDPFKADYVDLAFQGSRSIKKVLPVVCPGLSYDNDAVGDGGTAVTAWVEMVETINEHKRAKLARELKQYCALDTFAMVRIFQFLQTL